MINAFRSASLQSTFATGLLTVCLSASALAVTAPQAQPLPNLDTRKGEFFKAPYTEAGQKAAITLLQAAAPSVRVQRDAILGTPQSVRVRNGFLSQPTGANVAAGDLDAPVKTFLNSYSSLFGEGATVLTGAAVVRESVSPEGGMRSKVWAQQLDGVPVFEGSLAAHTTRQGALISISSRMVPNLGQVANASVPNHAALVLAPPMTAATAVARAAQNIGLQLEAAGVAASGTQSGWQKFTAPVLAREAIARLTWLPVGNAALSLCWEVWLTDRTQGHQYRVLVDAQTGAVQVRRFMTRSISDVTYTVYTKESPTPFLPGCPFPCSTQPLEQPRLSLAIAAVDTNASPLGWIGDTTNVTTGNNVIASTDLNGDEIPDLPYTAGTAFRVFDYPIDLTQPAATYSNAAVVQFFYYLNKAHDVLWLAGFDEAAGNFQTDNFARGGFGGDPLLANAQSANAVNNAYANPAPDGISPTLNMGLFTNLSPNRDSDLDQMVALHEMFHAVSDRLDGGILYANDYQSGGMQEGWSDFAGLILNVPPATDPDAVYPEGGYLTYLLVPGFTQNYYYGIRRYPYCTDLNKNPLTYKDIDENRASTHVGVPISPIGWQNYGAGEVHNAGEVWCATLWEMRAALVKAYGQSVGDARALQLVIDGLKLLNGTYTPSFLDARDAILDADKANYNGDDVNLIWGAFAKRGMGFSATSPASGSSIGVVEAFDAPALVLVGTFVTGGNGNGVIDPNECNQLSIILSNVTDSVIQGELGSQLTSQTFGIFVETASSPYPTIPPHGIATNTIPFNITSTPSFPCGTTINFTLVVKTGTGFTTLNVPVATTGGSTGVPIRFDDNAPLDLPDLTTVEAGILVSNITGAVVDVSVSLYIQHSFDGDLNISLVSPDNTIVPLSARNGGGGDNFGTSCSPDGARTTFTTAATTNIGAATAPFVGSYIPDGSLSQFSGKTGNALNGVWRLRITDELLYDSGTLNCWSLSITPSVCTNGNGPCTPSPLLCAETSLTFADQGVGSAGDPQTVHVQNCGTLPLTITNVVITGTDASSFAILSSTCTGATLAPGETCEVQVLFSPAYAGGLSAALQFYDNAPDSPQSIALNGTGILCTGILISPPVIPAATNGLPYSFQLSPGAAQLPVIFYKTAGSYPPGITMDSAGLISGTSTTLGAYTFKVKIADAVDCAAEKFYTLNVVCPALVTLPGALPLGQINVEYSQQLTGSGGVAPYTFTQVGGSLPAGMTLSSSGLLSGTPTSGSSVFVVRVTDVNGCSSDRTYTITLAIPPPVIFVGPTNLPVAAVTLPYSANITAAGGIAPHTFSLSSGSLPGGVQLSSAGILTGNPTKAGVASFTVKATDALGHVGTRAFALDVKPGVTDLGVTVNASASAVQEGDAVVYTVTVTNHGSLPAANCQFAGSLTSANAGTLLAGASATLQVTVPTTAAGVLTQTVRVSCDLADTNAVNDAVSVQTTVNVRPHSLVQFQAANQMVGAGAGQVGILVTRTGNIDQPASAHYYTTDGTAQAGVDYGATSGQVNFAAGATSQTVWVSLLPGNGSTTKSFALRLNGPGLGVQLGTLGQTACTILPKTAGNVVTVQDPDGDEATIQLIGPGALAATLAVDGTVDELTLTGTQPTSSLVVAIKRGAAGDGLVRIGRITADGSLRTLTFGTADFAGTIITVNGSLGSLRAGAVKNANITSTGSLGSVRVTALQGSLVAAGFTPSEVENPLAGGLFTPGVSIKAVTAKSLAGSTVAAATIGKAKFGAVAVDNDGHGFGVLAQSSITGVGARTPSFKWSKTGGLDQSVGDFHVRR